MDGLSSESGEDSSSGRLGSRRLPKSSDEYRKRRERNNLAVKKSRMKTKVKTQNMMERVTQLKTENLELEENIKILTKELGILKDMFVAHAGNAHGVKLNDEDLVKMLYEDSDDVDEGASLLMSLSQGPPL